MTTGPRLLSALAVGALALSGCSTGDGAGSGGPDGEAPAVTVLAAFYPLQHVFTEVGGDDVVVESLTPPGAEPHDLELSPHQVRTLSEADVVAVLGGFQPAVDEAVTARAPQHLLDAGDLPEIAEHMSEGEAHGDDVADEDGAGEDVAAEDGADEDGHDHAGGDPHFWLDPTLLAVVADAAADVLSDADPEGAEGYRARAAALVADLTALDEEMTTGLASCERDTIVVMHEAFGFLAERYDLEQVAVAGLDPESEPSPARLREVRETVQAAGVTTIFSESAADPRVAETLAGDLGLSTAVLDPLETQADPDQDYGAVMRANLEALRSALGCA